MLQNSLFGSFLLYRGWGSWALPHSPPPPLWAAVSQFIFSALFAQLAWSGYFDCPEPSWPRAVRSPPCSRLPAQAHKNTVRPSLPPKGAPVSGALNIHSSHFTKRDRAADVKHPHTQELPSGGRAKTLREENGVGCRHFTAAEKPKIKAFKNSRSVCFTTYGRTSPLLPFGPVTHLSSWCPFLSSHWCGLAKNEHTETVHEPPYTFKTRNSNHHRAGFSGTRRQLTKWFAQHHRCLLLSRNQSFPLRLPPFGCLPFLLHRSNHSLFGRSLFCHPFYPGVIIGFGSNLNFRFSSLDLWVWNLKALGARKDCGGTEDRQDQRSKQRHLQGPGMFREIEPEAPMHRKLSSKWIIAPRTQRWSALEGNLEYTQTNSHRSANTKGCSGCVCVPVSNGPVDRVWFVGSYGGGEKRWSLEGTNGAHVNGATIEGSGRIEPSRFHYSNKIKLWPGVGICNCVCVCVCVRDVERSHVISYGRRRRLQIQFIKRTRKRLLIKGSARYNLAF